MSLTWHIVRKDLRRMAVPTGIWCALVAVITLAMRTVPMTLELAGPLQSADLAAAASRWINVVETFIGLAMIMQTSTGVVLVASLLQQDSLVGTRAFWQTRPISDGRLLRAKLIAGTLLFVLAPALVIAAIGWSCGFSWREGTSAAAQLMLWQGIAVGVGFAVGSITANLGTFLFTALLGSALFPIIMIGLNSGVGRTAGQGFMLKCIVTFGPAIIFLAQVLGRKRKLGWWAYGTALVLAVLAALGTPKLVDRVAIHWNKQFQLGSARTEVDRQLVVRLAPGNPGEPHTIRALVDRAPTQDAIPVVLSAAGRFPNGNRFSGVLGPRWGDVAALRLIGADKGIAPATWQLDERAEPPIGDPIHIEQASAVVAWARPVMLWETPIRIGARVASGATATEIVAVHGDETGVTLILRESDARTRWRSWPNLGSVNNTHADARDHDCFLLRDTAQGTVGAVDRVDLRAVSMNGMMITARTLHLERPPSGRDPRAWLDGQTLVKVRFITVRDFFAQATPATTNLPETASPTLP